MLLILAIQVRSGGDIEEGSVSLEVSDPVQYGGAGRDPTLDPSIDDVGHQPKTGCAVGGQIQLRGDVASDHDVVARGLRLLLRHPKPEGSFPGDHRVVGDYLRVA